MEIVLKEDVEKVGGAGEKVKVADGYGRNYLIPQGLAIEASSANTAMIDQHMKNRAKKLAAQKSDAEAMAAEIAKLHLVYTRRAGEDGKLFGSLTASEIGRSVVEKGFQIDKRKILLDMPIKQLGEHEVKIKLHPEVTGIIKVEIQPEEPQPDLTAEATADTADTADTAETEEPKEETAEENPAE